MNGQEVEIHPGEDIELSGPGPGEGRLLRVAQDDDDTDTSASSRTKRGWPPAAIDVARHGYDTPGGVILDFSPPVGGRVGLLLPAGAEYQAADVIEESRLIMSEHIFCVTADGQLHARDFVPSP